MKRLDSCLAEWFSGAGAIRFENGKVTHAEVSRRQMWQHKDLPTSDSEGT